MKIWWRNYGTVLYMNMIYHPAYPCVCLCLGLENHIWQIWWRGNELVCTFRSGPVMPPPPHVPNPLKAQIECNSCALPALSCRLNPQHHQAVCLENGQAVNTLQPYSTHSHSMCNLYYASNANHTFQFQVSNKLYKLYVSVFEFKTFWAVISHMKVKFVGLYS